MNHVAEDILMHYGVKRRSGRYPWGSGGSPYQHSGDFISRVEELTRQGLNEKERAKALGLSTTDLRMQVRVANHERRELQAARARSLRADGKSLNEIAAEMGFKNDSSVRSLLDENTAVNKNRAKNTAEILKKELENKTMIDVGVGVERYLDVSPNTLKEAIFILETEGYHLYGVGMPQVPASPGKQTTLSVLAKPEVTYADAYQNPGAIKEFGDFRSEDGGTTFTQVKYPSSIDSSRVSVRYGDEGGTSKDGVVELRRGVADLDLGTSHYAQVRILVDGTHYIKGMAMYSDDMPDGADIVFNTNKKSGTPIISSDSKNSVLKSIKDDPINPFGAYIKANGQSEYTTADGSKKLSVINKIKEEGDWEKMSRNLSSQFLSKQPVQFIKKQLGLTYSDSEAELDEILSLTNPTVKKKLLLDFAESCDSAVVHLKAAALPRQSTQVILPITAMKENEVYAQNYKNGEKVVLIRYPHGGTFEIPELTVNNKNPSARSILGDNVKDAVGINPKVAEKLSGADFDGDQVVVIPVNDRVKIQTQPSLRALENFNPKDAYPETEGMRYMTKAGTQREMGQISNLITDMTLKGAPTSEIARAVKHSMVVIDAEKHKLDYKKSEKENGIKELKNRYQGYIDDDGNEVGGASTLLSRRKQDVRIPERQGSGVIDKETGVRTYKQSGRTYTDPKTGEKVLATTSVKLLNQVDDVRTLSSGTLQENAYADYANKMKALGNRARKEYTTAGKVAYNASAKTAYQKEVSHLNAQLNVASMNAPRERQAQIIANAQIRAKIQEDPTLKKDKKELRKTSQQAIYNARAVVGASGRESRITISDREWEAIQAGAITDSKLSQILKFTDPDAVRQRATPRTANQLSVAKTNKIKAMAASGMYTNAEIAESIGVSPATVAKAINPSNTEKR